MQGLHEITHWLLGDVDPCHDLCDNALLSRHLIDKLLHVSLGSGDDDTLLTFASHQSASHFFPLHRLSQI